MRYFAVICKRGHCGRKQYVPIEFAIEAQTAIEAMDKAKSMPGVKHSQPVLSCREITPCEYNRMRRVSAYHRLEYKYER